MFSLRFCDLLGSFKHHYGVVLVKELGQFAVFENNLNHFYVSFFSVPLLVIKLDEACTFVFNCSWMVIFSALNNTSHFKNLPKWCDCMLIIRPLHWNCLDWLEFKRCCSKIHDVDLTVWYRLQVPTLFVWQPNKRGFGFFFLMCLNWVSVVLKEAPTSASKECNLQWPSTSLTHQRCSQGLPLVSKRVT